MMDFFTQSVFFGVFLTLVCYEIGLFIKKKTGSRLANPLLLAILMIIAILAVTKIPYESYKAGSANISYLLTPATVCLAVPLYEQFELLKKNAKAVVAGIVSGVLTSAVTILLLCLLFGLGHTEYVTLLPKSITTAIGMGVSEELGGIVTLTVATIIITGITGNIFAEMILRIFKIREPIAKGVAIGSASHAIGTAKAMELGEIEGAMSSLSLAVSGLLTVVVAVLFSYLH